MNIVNWIRRWWQWRQYSDQDKLWFAWWADQQRALEAGDEIEPPWKAFPQAEFGKLGPMWGGWRQGNSEAWIYDIWYVFWNRLDNSECSDYLDRHSAPAYWREFLERRTHAEQSESSMCA